MSAEGKILKKLQPLVRARLAQLESGAVTPGSSAPIDAPWLSRPGLDATYANKNALTEIKLPGGSTVKVNYHDLPADTISLLNSVDRLKRQVPEQHHSSFLGKVWGAIEKPYHAVTGAIEEQGKWAEGSHKGESVWDRIKANAEALGKGAEEGWEGKKNLSASDLRKEFENYKAPIPASLDPVRSDQVTKNRVGKAVSNFLTDVAVDPITYTGVGGLTKVKALAHSAEDIAKIKEVERTLLDTKATAKAQNVPETFLGPLREGKYYTKRQLSNSAQKTIAMRRAREISKAYGHIAFNKTFNANRKIASEMLAKQGIKEYDGLTQMRKFLKGDANTEDLIRWNTSVQEDVERLAAKLTGDRTSFVTGKAGELLDIAAKNNLAGDTARTAEQIQKTMALKLGGKNVLKVKVPESAVTGAKGVVASEKLKGVKDFSSAIHGHFNTVFRTGSHFDPLVNAMRAAKHSSIVDLMNNRIRNVNSIWGGVDREERKRIAEAIANDNTNVEIRGGHDLDTGVNVDHLVKHGISKIREIERLVGKEKAITPQEFNRALPNHYRLPTGFFKEDNWLQNAWRNYYLRPDAPHHLAVVGKDPAVFITAMQKAAFSALADKELIGQYIKRFGHKLYDIDPKTGKRLRGSYSDPITRVLVDKHHYRTPSYMKGSVKHTIPGYEGAVFHPDTASGIESIYNMMRREEGFRIPGGQSPPAQFFDKATSLFKTVVTKFNPGFHERNLFGEMMSGAADGVVSVKPYRQSLQVLRLHGMRALDTGEIIGGRRTLTGRHIADSRVHNAILPDAYKKARIAELKGNDVVIKKHYTDLKSKGATVDQIWHAYVANGLKTGWITTDTGKYVGRFGGARVGTNVNARVQHLTENIEDYARLAHFISRIERSKFKNFEQAAEEAATYVRKYHFDYNDFTQIEKSVLSRVFPFYKWTRKNIPLQFALLFQKPGYFLAQMKGLNAISNAAGFPNNGKQIPVAEQVMPQWLKDHLAVPIGVGNSGIRYLDAPLPTTDAFKFFGSSPTETYQNLAYMANPLIKDPMEIATGHQIGGAPIQTDRYVSAQTPYSNIIHNILNKNNTGKTTNLLQFLLGAGVVENTPARIKSELKREQSLLSAVRKKYREQHNLPPLR